MMAELTGLTKVEEELQKGATPAICMQRANTSLSFMGIGGRKWSPNEEEMKALLARLGRLHGGARFLLLDPLSEVGRDLSLHAGNEPRAVAKSIERSLQQFKRVHDAGFKT